MKAGSYSLLGYAAQLGFAFVSFLFLVRWLSEYEFGVWVLYLTVTSFAEMGRAGLLQNAVIKFCVEEEKEYGDILTSGLIINTIGGLMLGGILILIAPFLSRLWSAPELVNLMWWYLPWALIHGTARFFDFPHMVHHDFKGIFWSKFANGATFLSALLVLWLLQGNIRLEQMPIIQVSAGIPSLLVFFFYKKSYLQWGKYSKKWTLKIVHFGKFVLGTNISSMLFNKMDLMMVGSFINPAAVAIYNVATRVTNYLEVPMSGISQIIYPKIAMANNDSTKADIADLYEKAVGVIVALVLPLVFFVLFFSEWVVVLIAGKTYASAAPLLQILVLAVMIKPWGRLFGITMDAIGKPQLNFALLATSLMVNIFLNSIFISWWGLQGAAIATLSSMVFLVVSGQLFITRYVAVNQMNILKQIARVYLQPQQLLAFGRKN